MKRLGKVSVALCAYENNQAWIKRLGKAFGLLCAYAYLLCVRKHTSVCLESLEDVFVVFESHVGVMCSCIYT
jgi:hypothetical protein